MTAPPTRPFRMRGMPSRSAGRTSSRVVRWIVLALSSAAAVFAVRVSVSLRGARAAPALGFPSASPPKLAPGTPSPRTGLVRRPLTPDEIRQVLPALEGLDEWFEPHPQALYRPRGGTRAEIRVDDHPLRRIRLANN